MDTIQNKTQKSTIKKSIEDTEIENLDKKRKESRLKKQNNNNKKHPPPKKKQKQTQTQHKNKTKQTKQTHKQKNERTNKQKHTKNPNKQNTKPVKDKVEYAELNALVKNKRRTRAQRKRKELIQETLEARKGPRQINKQK